MYNYRGPIEPDFPLTSLRSSSTYSIRVKTSCSIAIEAEDETCRDYVDLFVLENFVYSIVSRFDGPSCKFSLSNVRHLLNYNPVIEPDDPYQASRYKSSRTFLSSYRKPGAEFHV